MSFEDFGTWSYDWSVCDFMFVSTSCKGVINYGEYDEDCIKSCECYYQTIKKVLCCHFPENVDRCEIANYSK